MFITIVRSLLCVVLFVSSVCANLNDPTLSRVEYEQYIKESNEFKAAESDINSVYRELMITITDGREQKVLRDEQREWLKKRNEKAFSEGPKGSQIYIDALIKLTTQRSSELKAKLLNLKQETLTPESSPASEISPDSQSSKAIEALPVPQVSQTTPQTIEKQSIQQQSESQSQSSQQSSSESNNQVNKYIIIALLLVSVVSVILHYNGTLVIYRDYTDAAITICGALGSLVILFVCKNILGTSETAANAISLLVFLAIFIFVFRMTYITNKNIAFSILSLLTKYALISLYAFLLVFALLSSGSSRKKYEKKITYERRQKAETAAMLAVISGIFIFVVHITTKISEWSPIGDYFSLNFSKLNLDEVASTNENENN